MVGGKWKPLELPLTREIVNQKQLHLPRGIAEITITIEENVKNPGVGFPLLLPSTPYVASRQILEKDGRLL